MGCYPSEGARIEDLLCQRTQQVGETKGLQNENLNSVIYLQNLWFSTQLKVVEDSDIFSCVGCYFLGSEQNVCDFQNCLRCEREDNKLVKFVRIYE